MVDSIVYDTAAETEHDYICEGCEKVLTIQDSVLYRCTVYKFVPPAFIRMRCCPFNRKVIVVKKEKVRVGQQKQRPGRS
jgi:hypothetical protein